MTLAWRKSGSPVPLERDDSSSNRHPVLCFCLSMISAQTLCVCREGKPVPTFPDHALALPVADADGFARPNLDPRIHSLRIERVGVTPRAFASRYPTPLRRGHL